MFYVISTDEYQKVNLYKIGITKDLTRRIREHQTFAPTKIEVFSVYETSNDRYVERFMLARFASDRLRGEWIEASLKDIFNHLLFCHGLLIECKHTKHCRRRYTHDSYTAYN